MQAPHVILIGGPPGAGKTTLARALARRLGSAATTGDDLVISAQMVSSPDTHPDLHMANGLGHVRYFTESEPERLIHDAGALADAMWPVVEAVVRRHVEEADPIVIDWWLLQPSRVASLGSTDVASVWIHVDPAELDRRERAVQGFRDGSDDPDRMHANFMARSLWRNSLVADEARAHGLPILEQPGERSVDDLVDAVIAVVASN